MLPDFPSLKARRFDVLLQVAQRLVARDYPVLDQVGVQVQHEGATWEAQDVEGRPAGNGYEKIESSFETEVGELPNLGNDEWIGKLGPMITRQVRQQMELLLQRVSDAAASVGNVVHSTDQLSEEAILSLMSKVHLDFDNGELSSGQTMVMSPQQAERFAKWTPSDEFNRRFADIVERQRIDWRLREADRKLVD